jgi:hypothetical protein
MGEADVPGDTPALDPHEARRTRTVAVAVGRLEAAFIPASAVVCTPVESCAPRLVLEGATWGDLNGLQATVMLTSRN